MIRFILLALAISLSFTANAQLLKLNSEAKLDNKVLEINVEGPSLIALDLQKELNLTEAQYAQVLELNKKRFQLITAAEAEYQSDAMMLSKIVYGINLEADKTLHTLLDPRQARLLIELEGRQHTRFVSENAED